VPLAGMSYADASPPRPLRLLRRDWIESGLSEEAFDSQPRRRRSRPTAKTACSVPGCEGEVSCRSLCFSHERSWRRTTLSVTSSSCGHGR